MKKELNMNEQAIKTTTPKKFCFVLMPINKDFDDVYELGIKKSCIDAGAYCERVDEQIFDGSILDRIYNQISKADIIIADLTNKNPNVFYEVGYAHALGKLTILLTKNAEDIPFDLKHYPHIIYDNSIIKIKEKLTKRVKWFVEHKITSDNDIKVGIEVYLGDKSLSSGNVVYNISKQNVRPDLILFNNTLNTYNPKDYRVGIITDKELPIHTGERLNNNVKAIKQPDKKFLYMLSIAKDILYPGLCTNLSLVVALDTEIDYDEKEKIIIRIFTPAGTRDFPLTLKLGRDPEWGCYG